MQKFFEIDRWHAAINAAVDKDMDKSLLRHMSSPTARIELYQQMKNCKYVIAPPHEARIPKDDGSFRTVYVNDGIDRIVLSIINDMLFELCPELVHPQCKSYQKGIGCGKIVQSVTHVIESIDDTIMGVKMDLSKYFDSVPLRYIDSVFDYIEDKFGRSAIIDIVRTYYHSNTVIDINGQPVEKYSSLRQGCAVAAFLADAVLYDIDSALSSQSDIYYVRYSDDILILGRRWKSAYETFKALLAEKELVLNPKKVEILEKDKWFKFLGFSIKNNMISLSKSRVRTFEHEILQRTIYNKSTDINKIIKDVNRYLYKSQNEHSWATNVLPIINVTKDIQIMNSFVMDAIRACATNKYKIGGLGCCCDRKDHTLMRGTGKNVTENRRKLPVLNGYKSINMMRNALLTSKPVFMALTMNM